MKPYKQVYNFRLDTENREIFESPVLNPVWNNYQNLIIVTEAYYNPLINCFKLMFFLIILKNWISNLEKKRAVSARRISLRVGKSVKTQLPK